MRETVQVRMLDLSRGGCGVLLPEGFQARTLPVGTNLRSVKVDLSGNLVFMMSAKVIWTTMVRDKDTLECRLRAGLAWVAIAPANARSIQQYLDDVQRQRRMLMKG
jgi:c-di-GMP-binding flagellar brake protein YcgR